MKNDVVYITVSDTEGEMMLREATPVKMTKATGKNNHTIVIDPTVTDQPMLGMGANLTDTDVYNILRMSREKQDEVLNALFHPDKGAGWNFLRLPFGSTDWERTCEYYTYDDMSPGEKDPELKYFSVQRDIDRGFFELCRRIKEINPDMLFMGSVWGVPGWMKTNDSIMFGRFNPNYTDVYARYLRMAVQAFNEQGIELMAITTQNETLTGDDRATPACRFNWRMQKDVLLALRKEFDEYGISTEIWAYDHNFNIAHAFVDPLLEDKEAYAVIDAVAFHDYDGCPTVMGKLKEKYPDMPFYMTERFMGTVDIMDNYVQQLRNGARSYLQWTIIYDEYGGPHQFLGRPFIYNKPIDPKRQTFIYNQLNQPDKWFKTPAYGMYAQFTKYIKRDMKRVDSTGGNKDWLTSVAFTDDNGEIALVSVNQTDEEQHFTLRIGGAEADLTQPANSVATYQILQSDLCLSESCSVDSFPQEVITAPDAFDLEPIEILLDGELSTGNEIKLSCRVLNSGSLPTPHNATLMVEFSIDGVDEYIGRSTTCIPPIKPNDSIVVECNVPIRGKRTWTAEQGYHTLFAQVTIGNTFPEQNRTNNTLGCEVFIR